MAEIKNFPNNVDEYIGAEYVMKWLHGRSSGVFGADGNLSVTSNGDMTVSVSDGVGWLANDKADGTVFWNDTKEQTGSELQLEIPLSDPIFPRIDRVVVSWDTVDYAAKPRIEVLKGTVASTPVAPALTNNSLLRQISLAQIAIPAAASKITSANITDERLDVSVCGIVTETVKIDTTTMQSQFEALLKAVSNELAGLVGGTGFDPTPVRFENVKALSSYFRTFTASSDEETKLIEMGYEYRASVPVSGVLETMFPYLTVSLYDVEESGIGLANQFRCYNGGVYLYSDGIPETTITILTAEFRKAVS